MSRPLNTEPDRDLGAATRRSASDRRPHPLAARAVLDGRVSIVRMLPRELLAFVTTAAGTDLKVNWRSGTRGWRCSCDRTAPCWHLEAVALVAAPGHQRPPSPSTTRTRRRTRAR
jgi:hypothetical protein